MAAQNNNGLIITLSCSMLLSVILAVFTWMTVRNNSELTLQATELKTGADEAKRALQDQISQVESLKKLVIGHAENPTDAVVTEVTETISGITKDGAASSPGLESALVKTGVERDIQKQSSDDRMAQLNQKTLELQQTIERKDGEIKSHQDAALQANESLRKSEAQHSEELTKQKKTIDELIATRTQLEEEFSTYKTQKNREIEDLQDDLEARRNVIVVLRTRLFQQEDLSFDRPDGEVTFVDQNSLKCYVNLGQKDEVREGTTFSVYTKSNNGVGRRNTEDVKGKVEIVNIMGPHLSEARMVDQDLGRPLAKGDPIYSPLFSAGQQLKIAVVGKLDFDGNPGTDADEFIRIVRGAGAAITVRTSDTGELIDEAGQPLQPEDLKSRITEKTRFLVIGDTGEDSDTQDTVKQSYYRRIQQQSEKMNEQALSHGVYVISLSSFLEFIGYSKKRLAWTPPNPFPGKLSNGAKSSSVSTGLGGLGQRESSAAISGTFSKRRHARSESTGHTSKAYSSSRP